MTITTDRLKAIAHGAIMDKAQSVATGEVDPIAEAIANATARVRRAVSTGNVLDADAGKVPASLAGLATHLALYDLMERIGLSLSEDQGKKSERYATELLTISKNKEKVEAPDTPAASGEMQATGGAVEAVNVPRRQTGRERTGGL